MTNVGSIGPVSTAALSVLALLRVLDSIKNDFLQVSVILFKEMGCL